jgi:hypothetical protein
LFSALTAVYKTPWISVCLRHIRASGYLCLLTVNVTDKIDWQQAGWCHNNALDLYSGSSRFKPQQDWPYWPRLFAVFLSSLGQIAELYFHQITPINSWSLPIHHPSIVLPFNAISDIIN